MTRSLPTLVVLIALAASAAGAAPKAVKADHHPVPTASVADAIARAGATDKTMELRDLVAFEAGGANDRLSNYAERRSAMRACHAERYATARDNVLTGRAAPLRDC